MSFLLSLFFTVPVSSTLGFLLLPLHWVFFILSFYSSESPEISLSLAPAVLGLLLSGAELRLFQTGTIDVRGMCDFFSSVSSQQKFEAMDQHYIPQTDHCHSSVFQLSFIRK